MLAGIGRSVAVLREPLLRCRTTPGRREPAVPLGNLWLTNGGRREP